MRKILKLIGKIFLFALIAFNVWILVSGQTWIYKALVYNFVDIDDRAIFTQRQVPNGTPRPWPLAANYNKVKPDTATENELIRERSVAWLVIHNDSILYEAYWEGFGDSALSNSFSMSKSVIGVLTGIALKEGAIKNLDQRVNEFIPEYKDDSKGKLTLRHLITMSAALSWDEAYSSLFSVTTEAYYGKDLKGLMDGLEVVGTPGKDYYYQGGATQLLAMVIMRATGKNLSEYCSEKLWKPIGAEYPAEWTIDREGGMEKASCCIYSNARDFARIGALYLHLGNMYGNQLVDTAFVLESVMPAPLLNEGKPNLEYGYQWWISEVDGNKFFYCRGILGQYIVAVPSKNIIMVRLGHHRNQAPDKSLIDLPIYVRGAIKMADLN
ncbi:MAG: serine hydrolase [Bacteroidetes bacterium]|nr:serine hydrolase [Bacteroidota bacterium]